ncbi:MAG: hypothetical protein K1X57_03865 [Gemmataceae bacterium]|nr:hypothetical protein [Gemmataceae bacterium]
MNPAVLDVIRESESRYLSDQEMQSILEYTESLPERFRAARAIEDIEDQIVQATIDQVKKRYPSFERYHPSAWDKGYRDVQLTLRYCVQAMVWEDPMMHEEKLLVWLGTILASFGFTPQFNRDTYVFLRDNVKQRVSEDIYSRLAPFLDKNIEVLGGIPEPHQPLV